MGSQLTSEEGSDLHNKLLVLHRGTVLDHELGHLAGLGRLCRDASWSRM